MRAESGKDSDRRRAIVLGSAWVLVSTLAGALVGAGEGGVMQFFASLFLEGFVVGAAQALVIRALLPRSWPSWIFATGLGAFVTTALRTHPAIQTLLQLDTLIQHLWQTYGLWEVFWLNLVHQTMRWGVVGVLQWLVLRSLPRAWIWLPLSLVAGLLYGASSPTACLLACDAVMQRAGGVAATAVPFATGWLLSSAVTAPLIIWWGSRLLRAP